MAYHYEGVNTGKYAHTQCAGKVRAIQRFHMDTRGWADIAYSALVCPHGYVYEGRWLNARTAANGTDAGNSGYYAVCYIGGPNDPLTDAAKVAFRDVTRHLRDHGGAGAKVKPHSALKATACPGDTIRAWIAAGTPAPVVSPPATRKDPILMLPAYFGLGYVDSEVAAAAAALHEGVHVTSLATAKQLKTAGGRLIVIGGGAIKSLGLDVPVGKVTTVGNVTACYGESRFDGARMSLDVK